MDDYGDVSFGYEADYGLPGNRVGLALIGAMGLISALSTLVLIGYIMVGYLVCELWPGHHDQPMVQGIRSFTHSALGVFLCSLLISDMIQGAAFAINFKWAADGSVHSGLACTAQGAVSQFGDLGSALWSLAISMHTFSLLFLVQKPPVWLTWMIFIAGWVLITVLPIVGPYGIQKLETKGEFYGVSGAWCWIGHGYHSKPTGWSSGLFSSGVHEPTATSRPYSTFQSHSPSQRMTESEKNGIGKHLKSISKRLMLYPLGELHEKLTGVAACRIGAVSGWKPPLPMYIFAGISFTSSGLTNVILFIVTRHALLRKVVSVRPQIHVTTHQVTVLEDARGVQTIHLPRLGKPSEDRESNSDNSVSEELDESFGMSKKYESVPAGSAPPSPNPAGNAYFRTLSLGNPRSFVLRLSLYYLGHIWTDVTCAFLYTAS
ncbi:slime mold cyclic AMP receptor domain-containing protein [Rhizoctonia solani AG-1 IA]|uniref:Slime mold cyclic AMP receptor domain-containing protein n=1 Tax=Thanatephorus cucumeris (strain AG1-IA) TaxID=983506 RepID=L8WS41_THACA|nr:slime mold cyclic AMP receptor domain-containing protein [Rhizoctonia solani AG-1 IA]